MKPTRVLAVGLSANRSMRGVERVVYESLKAVGTLQDRNSMPLEIDLLMGDWQTYYLGLRDFGVRLHVIKMPNRIFFRHLFTWIVVPLWSLRFDVLHVFNTIPVAGSLAGKFMVTIHDLAEFACPKKYSPLQAWYRRLVARHLARVATTILTVSAFSRRQIATYLGRPDAKVASNGIDHLLTCVAPRPRSLQPASSGQAGEGVSGSGDRPCFLYYGVVERSKGLDLALAAFVRLKSEHPECVEDFLIAGDRGNLFDDLAPYLSRDDVIYLGFVADEEIARLIRGAKAVLFLSEYEGFGFPALEAIALGATVIVSKNTVLEELCAPFCLTANPHDPDSVIAAMLKARKGETDWDAGDAATRLAERFSWTATALLLLDEYLAS